MDVLLRWSWDPWDQAPTLSVQIVVSVDEGGWSEPAPEVDAPPDGDPAADIRTS